MDRTYLAFAAAFGFLGVAGGAFGAHAVRATIPRERLATFETAARYLLYGAFELFAVEWVRSAGPDTIAASLAGVGFLLGTVAFSGSLALLVLTDERRWGAVAPIGGVLLLAGWALLLVAAFTAPLRFDFFR